MKHIKPFNESKENLIEELQDLCESHLAYLLDDGFKISIFSDTKDSKEYLELHFGYIRNGSYTEQFYWDGIKDYFIPLLQILIRRYKLLAYTNGFVCFKFNAGFKHLSLDQVINDRISTQFGRSNSSLLGLKVNKKPYQHL